MAQIKYLDLRGLTTFTNKLKEIYATKTEAGANKTSLTELQSYFTEEGEVNKATADGQGNNISETYIKEITNTTNANTIEGKLGNDSPITSITVNNVAAAKAADNANQLEGHGADYFATATALSEKINGIIWKPNVENVTALKAFTTPKEGWTASVDDTNDIYRFDDQAEGPADDINIVAPDDSTPGFWIKLGFTNYAKASTSADGIMSKEQVAALEKATSDIASLQGSLQNGSVASAAKLGTARNFSVAGGMTAGAVAFDGTADVGLNVTSVDATTLQNAVPAANLAVGAVDTLGVVGVSAEPGNLLTIDEDSTLKMNMDAVEDEFIINMFNDELYYVNVKDDSDDYDILVNGEPTVGKTYFKKGEQVTIYAKAKGDTDQSSLKLNVTKVQ